MAKIVIAGEADCPYYARIEILADNLTKNLPHFKLHKIVKQPTEWQNWLNSTCSDRGWSHEKSPIVWRELVDRGGKGLLIGGANEFQEYAHSYYGLQSDFTSDDMRKIAKENQKTKQEVDEEERAAREAVKPVKVCVTNATSPVCYGMMEALAKGEALGQDTDLAIRLTGDESPEELEGVRMEVFDLACPLLTDVSVVMDYAEAYKDCSVIVMLDEVLQQEDESKDDWLKRNREHFQRQAALISTNAQKDVRVLLAGRGPVNFNAMMMLEEMPDFPKQNLVTMSRTVENHAKAVLAGRLNVNSAFVADVIVWGNSYDKHFLDLSKARVHQYDGAIWGPPSFSLPVGETVHDDKWLAGDFQSAVSERQSAVDSALGHRGSASQAAAAASLLGHWWCGAETGEIYSLGVCSEGWYGVPEGLYCSFPVKFLSPGTWSVVEDLELSEETTQKIEEVVKDLTSEREVIYPPPHVPTPSPTPEAEPSVAEGNTNNSNVSTTEDSGPVFGDLERITEDQEGEAAATQVAGSDGTPRSAKGTPRSGKATPTSDKGSPRSGKGTPR